MNARAEPKREEELIRDAVEAIRHTEDYTGYISIPGIRIEVPGYISGGPFAPFRVAPIEVVHWLSIAHEDRQALFAPTHLPIPEGYVGAGGMAAAARVVLEFLRTWFKEIRDILCTQGRIEAAEKSANFSGRAVATTLAAWITDTLGISSAVAIGLATLILLVLAQTAKDAFCQMTQEQITEGISIRLQDPRKR
jgi:hypothetical protein